MSRSWRDAFIALYSLDGGTGRWPSGWYRYIDWRLRAFPELRHLDASARREVLYETRRRLAQDPIVTRARLFVLGKTLLGVLVGLGIPCIGFVLAARIHEPSLFKWSLVVGISLMLAIQLGGSFMLRRLPQLNARRRVHECFRLLADERAVGRKGV